jgi:hypothetical protein
MNDYDDLADLDDVFGPLRSVARSAELSQESAMVDRMVNAHRTSEGKHMFRSRSARIATLVAAGVLGFGGMAAAGSPISEEVLAAIEKARSEEVTELEIVEEEVEEPEIEEPEIEEPEIAEPEIAEPEIAEPEIAEPEIEEVVVEPVLAEVEIAEEESSEDTPVELVDDPDTKFIETSCVEGNHGKTVSAVARGVFDLEKYATDNFPDGISLEDIPTVVDAAQSSCGKTDRVDDEIESEESDLDIEEGDDSDDAEVEEFEEPKVKAERPGKSTDGPGNGNGNGNGKPNGNGKRGG